MGMFPSPDSMPETFTESWFNRQFAKLAAKEWEANNNHQIKSMSETLLPPVPALVLPHTAAPGPAISRQCAKFLTVCLRMQLFTLDTLQCHVHKSYHKMIELAEQA
ncbi:hypothetical protein CPB84DRAFT_1826397 [Gymnopilus junonius]|uniref:Uncharacterized protein n=1 Tax=Gymnopilus junonius TaxID=109634 RepID=A0A9P5NGW8_GYMJU|nr:hypothetical protein CPB84DRAFT_1826397 [Gymnopilus junonius]